MALSLSESQRYAGTDLSLIEGLGPEASTNSVLVEPISIDPIVALTDFYTRFYKNERNDSPNKSRLSLAQRALPTIDMLGPSDHVLDLGAGKQIWVRELHRISRNRKVAKTPSCKFVTIDLASIAARNLLEDKRPDVHHVRANGAALPLGNETLDLVVSSMAFDFMPEKAGDELHRVMKPGARAFMNLHHPSLIPANLDELLQKRRLTPRQRRVYNFWRWLKDNNILTNDPRIIRERFSKTGLEITQLKKATDMQDTWWEVDLIKPTTFFRIPDNYPSVRTEHSYPAQTEVLQEDVGAEIKQTTEPTLNHRQRHHRASVQKAFQKILSEPIKR